MEWMEEKGWWLQAIPPGILNPTHEPLHLLKYRVGKTSCAGAVVKI
jgi:hypothetical protein